MVNSFLLSAKPCFLHLKTSSAPSPSLHVRENYSTTVLCRQVRVFDARVCIRAQPTVGVSLPHVGSHVHGRLVVTRDPLLCLGQTVGHTEGEPESWIRDWKDLVA